MRALSTEKTKRPTTPAPCEVMNEEFRPELFGTNERDLHAPELKAKATTQPNTILIRRNLQIKESTFKFTVVANI